MIFQSVKRHCDLSQTFQWLGVRDKARNSWSTLIHFRGREIQDKIRIGLLLRMEWEGSTKQKGHSSTGF